MAGSLAQNIVAPQMLPQTLPETLPETLPQNVARNVARNVASKCCLEEFRRFGFDKNTIFDFGSFHSTLWSDNFGRRFGPRFGRRFGPRDSFGPHKTVSVHPRAFGSTPPTFRSTSGHFGPPGLFWSTSRSKSCFSPIYLGPFLPMRFGPPHIMLPHPVPRVLAQPWLFWYTADPTKMFHIWGFLFENFGRRFGR